MSSIKPTRIINLEGNVILDSYGKGSKSEREALFIETADGRYLFRRKTGPIFDDTELRQYLGHKVECDGFLVGKTFLAERVKIID